MDSSNNNEALNLYFQNSYYVNLANMPKGSLSFNFYAAIFGAAWCFYRKLYLVGIAYFFIYLIITASITYFLNYSSSENLSNIVLISVLLVFRITLGIFINQIYIANSLKLVEKIKQSSSQEEVAIELKSAGGVNTVAVIAYYVLSIGFSVGLILAGIKI